MRILVYGINYTPELTGIGKYSGEMVEWLSKQGHELHVIAAPPYYPAWQVGGGYSSWLYRREVVSYTQLPASSAYAEAVVYSCALWVPSRPSGLKRLIHLASFTLSSFPVMLRHLFWRPHVVLVIEPPLMCAPATLLVSKLCRAKSWLHVQDFEVDAAFDLGILPSGFLRRMVLSVERSLMRLFDCVSTISPNMLDQITSKGVAQDKAFLFPNWVDTQLVYPLESPSLMRADLGIPADSVIALYSGNMGEKQGLEIVLEAAKWLMANQGIRFVLCGDGASKRKLFNSYGNLPNVTWLTLQPLDRLNDLLNMADIHLLPQRTNVADLVMPSKIAGMLASGRPVLATADWGTQVAQLVTTCGKVVEPGNTQMFIQGLLELANDPQQRKKFGLTARQASLKWDKLNVMHCFEEQLLDLCKK
jgi:colanic acid biosynthesis glycosyl transferase WcaI